MKILHTIEELLSKVFYPIRVNAVFFVFMYVLGVTCEWLTLPHSRGAQIYDNLYLELFFDLYLVCLLLTLLPKVVRTWVRRLLYVVLYAVAVVDVYCFVKFDTTLTPSMLMLVGETNSREAGEFLRSYLTAEVMFSRVGWVFLLVMLHAVVALRHRIRALLGYRQKMLLAGRMERWCAAYRRALPALGLLTVVCFVWGAVSSMHNKAATWRLMSGSTIGEVEHTLTERDHAVLYTPFSRLSFSIYANSLAAKQVDQLIAAADRLRVDSCSFRSPQIVLIIGESFGKHHSQQYGYFMETTPRQLARERSGLLVKFTDVVSPWNLTSFVFKNVLSMHVVGEKGEWCDYPLFPALFRKAGYQVTFLTNQFLPQAKSAVYDFSGGFFLNNPQLSRLQFDLRNDSLYRYDEGLLRCYDRFVREGKIRFAGQGASHGKGMSPASAKPSSVGNNLIVFHLIGQHVSYNQRYPRRQNHFYASSYEDRRPELNNRQRKILSYYDNAVLYNDSIVDQIIRRFENRDAIVIYMPDHGEECYEGKRGFICRQHSAAIDYDLARYEFEIPFWVYCSHTYAVRHPKIYKEIVEAKDRRFMTDALPHLLLYLADIAAPDYHDEYNILSPEYNENRPRILKNTTDYDKLKPRP